MAEDSATIEEVVDNVDENSENTEDDTKLFRQSLLVKYSQQLPFKSIRRTATGKDLLHAQMLWRDGTALFDTLGLPFEVDLKELPDFLRTIGLPEKEQIFKWCGEAILLQRKAIDNDPTDILLLRELLRCGPACKTFHAYVVEAFCCEFIFLNNLNLPDLQEKDGKLGKLVPPSREKLFKQAETAYYKAIRASADPRLSTHLANFKKLWEFSHAVDQEIPFEGTISAFRTAITAFEHRLPNHDVSWYSGSLRFDVYCMYALVLRKSVEMILQGGKKRKVTSEMLDKTQMEISKCLDLYLENAPDDHYHCAHACFWKSTEWVIRKAPPKGASAEEMYKRNPDDVKRSIVLFERGMKAMGVLAKWDPFETHGMKENPLYVEAKTLQEMLLKYEYRKDPVPELPVSDVELRKPVDEAKMTSKEKLWYNITDGKSVQFLYLIFFLAILMDPIFNAFGLFPKE